MRMLNARDSTLLNDKALSDSIVCQPRNNKTSPHPNPGSGERECLRKCLLSRDLYKANNNNLSDQVTTMTACALAYAAPSCS